MATFVLKNAFVSVNGVDLSDHLREVTLEATADSQESTAMGDDFREYEGGLKDWTISATFNQDFAAASVDATLWAALGTKVPVLLRYDAGVRAPTNPDYSGSALVTNYTPIGNAVGEQATAPLSLQGSGTLARLTS